MRKSIYLLTTTPSSHTHRFHPLPLATPASCSPHPLATPIHSTQSPQLSSILRTLHKLKVWMTIVESGWNVWVWLVGVVVRRYIDFLILLIPTPLVSVLFCSSIPTFCSFKKMFFVLVSVLFCNYFILHNFFTQYKHIRATTSVPRQPYEGCT